VSLLVPLGQYWARRPHEVARGMSRIDRSDPPRDMMRWRLDMSAAIAEALSGRGHEALAVLPRLIESAHAMGEPYAAAEAMSISGFIHWRQGDLQVARDEFVRATEGVPVVASRAHSAREGLAVLELHMGNTEEGARRVAELAAIAEEVPTPVTRASAANAQGWLEAFTGDPGAAAESFALCRDLAIDSDDWHHEVEARLGLAWVQPGIGHIDAAGAEALAARNMAAEAGIPRKVAEALVTLGRVKLDLGQPEEARLRLGESLVMTRDWGTSAFVSIQALMFVSWLARHDGRPDLAVRLLRAVEGERKRLGVVLLPMNAERAKQELELAMSETEPTVFGEAPILDIEAAKQEALDFLQPS
jgi:tetratricopeptide (TPR) repeat protein